MNNVLRIFMVVFFVLIVVSSFGEKTRVGDPGCSVTRCSPSCTFADTQYICSLSGRAEHYSELGNPMAADLTLSINCTFIGIWSDTCSKYETFSSMGSVSGYISCSLNSGPFQGNCLVTKSCTCN